MTVKKILYLKGMELIRVSFVSTTSKLYFFPALKYLK